MPRLWPALILMLFAGACAVAPETGPHEDVQLPARAAPEGLPPPKVAARNFITVVERLEPVVESLCRARTRHVDCDIEIAVDTRPGRQPNAFQTRMADGTPLIVFTIALIAQVRNQDELAFIMGHEAAHHLAGHLDRARASAREGAMIATVLAQARGADPATVRRAGDIGAAVGARVYSKEFELEADAIGTELALRAGFDPIRGAAYFDRLPDPGNAFLGTHPPNAARAATVRATLAALRRAGL